ncbi:MAG TPA: malectin domain-containing carbohydrate-binding protein, partial [Chthonomonadaceae bacterium]|nr:malectin domain-containing carbohydrate-binding protein [Chthonomonadaceae bacterium]
LSKPLGQNVPAKDANNNPIQYQLGVLKYRPFSTPSDPSTQETGNGWLKYVHTIAKFVASTLGTTGQADLGFDMEIWNELSFGSAFLDINNYYNPPFVYPREGHYDLVKQTAAFADQNPADFVGVILSDGFANTIPWDASSVEPPRIGAINKHPYPSRRTYPHDEYPSTEVNALGRFDPDSADDPLNPGFLPSYSVLFPEEGMFSLQTEFMERDTAPMTNVIQQLQHGRYTRLVNGNFDPCPVQVTETGVAPAEDNASITPDRALAIKAKSTARFYCFFLNKGVTQLYLYTADGNPAFTSNFTPRDGDLYLGVVQDNFMAYVTQTTPPSYPTNDVPYTSPALATLSHIVTQMSNQLDPTITSTRPIQVASIAEPSNQIYFTGDGTAAHPSLYNHDVLAILPYQVNAHRFVIPYYVASADIMQDMSPESFTVKLTGLNGAGATVTAYDPIKDASVPVAVAAQDGNSLTLNLTAVDYPYLLIVEEARAIDCGGGAVGNFQADQDFSGGYIETTTHAIDTSGVVNPAPQAVYQCGRFNMSNYTIPGLIPGTYKVRLHFAGLYATGGFNVSINGTPVLTNFDIVAAAGGMYKAVVKEFTASPDGSGNIIISFTNGGLQSGGLPSPQNCDGKIAPQNFTPVPSNGTPSIEGIEIIPLSYGPPAPTGVVATGGNQRTTFTWNAVAGATSYDLYRSTSPGGEGTVPVATGITGTSYTDLGVPNGRTFYYKLVAVNSKGEGAPSAEVSATPTGPATYQLSCGGGIAGTWIAATNANEGGSSRTNGNPSTNTSYVVNPAPQAVYHTAWTNAPGEVTSFALPYLVPGGQYTVRLHFSDIMGAFPGDHVMEVFINGVNVLSNFDIAQAAINEGAPAPGFSTAVIQQFTVTADLYGRIIVRYYNDKGFGSLSGIEVL